MRRRYPRSFSKGIGGFMSKGKFIAFLILIGVWMPGCFIAYILWLPGQKIETHTIFAFVAFCYAIFAPIVVYSFWEEFANLFGRKMDDARGELG
jgi:hypothetical protein